MKKPRSPTPTEAPPSVVLEDLARSGLRWEDLSAHLRAYNPHPIPRELKHFPAEYVAQAQAALIFQYYSLDDRGALTPSPLPRARMFYRPLDGFLANVEKDPRPKYLQPAKTPSQLYIPPTLDWVDFLSNKNVALVIVEGEKKALAYAARGIYAVALGGVDCYAPGQYGGALREEPIFPELLRLAAGRSVYIHYDLDANHSAYKDEVAAAAQRLAGRLMNSGAFPLIVVLRRPGSVPLSAKYAPDDWLCGFPAGTPTDELWEQLALYGLSNKNFELLQELNTSHAYIEAHDLIVRLPERTRMHVTAFYNVYRNAHATLYKPTIRKGQTVFAPVVQELGAAWMGWSGRCSCPTTEYVFGDARVILPGGNLNTWSGWAQPPNCGHSESEYNAALAPWFALLQHVHGDDWLHMLYWYLWPLTYPEDHRINWVPILRSEAQGVGKSFIAQQMSAHVYGHGNARTVNEKLFQSPFNDYLVDKALIIYDDVGNLQPYLEQLNSYVTNPRIHINPKGFPSHDIILQANAIITTNYAMPLRADTNQRRWGHIYVNPAKAPQTFWAEQAAWFERGGGGWILGYADFLRRDGRLRTVFDPKADAPITATRLEQEEVSMTWAQRWLEHVLQHNLQRDLVSYRELADGYRAWARVESGLAPAEWQSDARFRAVFNTLAQGRGWNTAGAKRPMNLSHRDHAAGNHVWYAVRNAERWEHADNDAWIKEIRRVRVPVLGRVALLGESGARKY